MKLIECYIENFGALCAKRIVFSEGLNCIREDNGAGKTTLTVFLKVMLFGLTDTKKTGLDENERKHYLPWQGGSFGGSLTFEAGGATYRVERSFSAKASEDKFALYDVKRGGACNDFSSNLGEELFGIDADGFERTVFLSERALSPKSQNKSIAAKLSDLVGTDGDIGVLDDAMKLLESERKLYFKKGGSGMISDTKASLSRIEAELSELEGVRASLPEKRELIGGCQEKLRRIEQDIRALESKRAEAKLRAADGEYAIRYQRMKEELSAAEKRRAELYDFFSGKIPTFREVEEAAYKYERARQIRERGESQRNSELEMLKNRVGGIDGEQLTRIKEGLRSIDNYRDQIYCEEFAMLDPMRAFLPEKEELDSLILRGEKAITQKPRVKKLPIALSIALAILGAVLGAVIHVGLFSICALSVLPILIGYMYEKKRTVAERDGVVSELERLFALIMPEKCPVKATDISLRTADLRRIELLFEKRAQYIEYKYNAESLLVGILEPLGFKANCDTVSDIARNIISDKEKYDAKLLAADYNADEANKEISLASSLLSSVDEFLSTVKTVSDDPFGEIRAALSEYGRLCERITSGYGELERYRSLHRVGETRDDEPSLAEIEEQLASLDAERRQASERLAILCRERDTAEGRLSDAEALVAEKEEQAEKLSKQEEALDIILLTQKYLTAAKDSMTVKYLGKTKSAFLEYMELISGVTGEYDMDTGFGISKREGGATRVSEYYSKGTRDLFALASRLALADALYGEEQPFIILDDPFMSFDDRKLRAAVGVLKALSKKRQIIYLTCSESRIAK